MMEDNLKWPKIKADNKILLFHTQNLHLSQEDQAKPKSMEAYINITKWADMGYFADAADMPV